MIRSGLRNRQEVIIAEARTVACPKCGFQWRIAASWIGPVFEGDVVSFLDLCRYLDEAPTPPAQAFYCIALQATAKRAAMDAEIETTRV